RSCSSQSWHRIQYTFASLLMHSQVPASSLPAQTPLGYQQGSRYLLICLLPLGRRMQISWDKGSIPIAFRITPGHLYSHGDHTTFGFLAAPPVPKLITTCTTTQNVWGRRYRIFSRNPRPCTGHNQPHEEF